MILIFGWFYWFQYRPSHIRQECARESFEAAHNVLVEKANSLFENAEKGLENGTIVNNTGKTTEEIKEEYLKKIEGNFDQDWYRNSYSACLHSKGL